VDILITSSAEMRGLNRRFCAKDAATDVLSFPLGAETRSRSLSTSSAPMRHGGDIAISYNMAVANARRLGHSPADELKLLMLHGLLHLAGYDHENDGGEMAQKEAHLRRTLGLPEALIERAEVGNKNGARVKKRRRS
jgi:probable rRNA maturation factor